MTKLFYDVEQAARRLNATVDEVEEMVSRGLLQAEHLERVMNSRAIRALA